MHVLGTNLLICKSRLCAKIDMANRTCIKWAETRVNFNFVKLAFAAYSRNYSVDISADWTSWNKNTLTTVEVVKTGSINTYHVKFNFLAYHTHTVFIIWFPVLLVW